MIQNCQFCISRQLLVHALVKFKHKYLMANKNLVTDSSPLCIVVYEEDVQSSTCPQILVYALLKLKIACSYSVCYNS
jgi:hypothetical protein